MLQLSPSYSKMSVIVINAFNYAKPNLGLVIFTYSQPKQKIAHTPWAK